MSSPSKIVRLPKMRYRLRYHPTDPTKDMALRPSGKFAGWYLHFASTGRVLRIGDYGRFDSFEAALRGLKNYLQHVGAHG